jgi:uncharacterized protein DUF87
MPAYKLQPQISGTAGDLMAGDPGQRGESWILLGTLAEAGPRRLLKLDITAEHVVAVVGKRGTGKSYSLGVILEGLGCGASPTGIGCVAAPRATLVFDVLDIFWTSALPLAPSSSSAELQKQYDRMVRARIDPVPVSVDVWVPAGLENASIDLPGTHALRIAPYDLTAEDWAALFDIDLIAEPRGMLLDELVRKVAVTGWVDDVGNQHGAIQQYGFADLLDCLAHDAAIAHDYLEATLRSIRQRLNAQAANPIFQGQPTRLSEILRPWRVSVLMMGRLPDSMKQVLASIITRQVVRERRDASFAKKRLELDPGLHGPERDRMEAIVNSSLPRTWILADEAQVLVPAERETLSGQSLIKYAKEGRNYGLSLAIATQQPSAVDPRLMSQVETLLIHQLAVRQDIDVALRSIKSPLPESIQLDGTAESEDSLLRALEQGDVFFSCANAARVLSRACVVRIRPRVTAHGGYEA